MQLHETSVCFGENKHYHSLRLIKCHYKLNLNSSAWVDRQGFKILSPHLFFIREVDLTRAHR